MYGDCRDPSCVDMEKIQNEQKRTLVAGGGEKIGPKKWWYPSHSANYSSRSGVPVNKVVIHTAEGYTGGLNTFRDPAREASAHYAIGWDGTRVGLVKEEDKAWHVAVGNINASTIGIEHVGFAHAMQPGTATEWSVPMLKASAKLIAELARRHGFPIDRDHIVPHAELDPSRRSDPGPYWPWDWYLRKAKWYYYRSYILAGVGVLGFAGLWYAARKRDERRIESWKRV